MAVECEQQFASTKVYYHLDASMPYLSEVPVPQEKLTLGDFKKVFTRKGYSYFCKEWDQRLQKEVKVEIWHDRQRLHKSANGLVELFLLSQNAAGPRNSNTLPKLKKEDGASTMSSLAASSDLDIGGGQRVSMVTGTEASSDLQTLISRRAGEHLADLYNSTSEDPYNRTSISSSCIPAPLEGTKERAGNSSTLLPMLGPKYRHRAGKKRGKPYVPSTISSESESSYSLPRIEEVKLRLQEAPLGISVACQDGSIFIYHIQHGSAAEKSGQMEIGDQIVQVNDIRFEDLDEKQALELLKKLNSLKKTITVYVAKRKRVNGESSTEERKSDALSMLCETKQLDISQWVESTAQQQGRDEAVQPFANSLAGEKLQSKKETALLEAKKWTEMEETSDEEMAAYMDRRNGKGAKLVPALTKARQQQQREEAGGKRHEMVVSEPFTLGAAAPARPLLPVVVVGTEAAVGNAYANCSSSPSALAQAPPLIQQPLHADMEPETILRRMVEPDSGLTIRDRKWLKIPVPMSFIGDEMVDWLLANVQGFRGRKAAKEFASKLLQKGLIKHVVNMSTFNQNCYYVFDDRIISARMMEKAERLAGEEGSRHSNIGEQQRELNGNGTVPMGSTALNANGRRNQPAMATGTAGIGIGPPESTTEITYMSDPTSPFPGQPARAQIAGADVPAPRMVVANNPRYVTGPASLNMCQPQKPPLASNNNHVPAIPLRVLNPTKVGPGHLPSWPISPILPFHRPPRAVQTAAAGTNEPPDSPEATNDYASLIQGEINCGAQFDVHFDGILQQQQMTFAPQRTAKENGGGGSNGQLPPSPAPIPASAPSGPPPPAVILPAPPLPQRHPFMAVPKRSPA